MLNFVATTAFTFWVAALRTRLSRCGHAWRITLRPRACVKNWSALALPLQSLAELGAYSPVKLRSPASGG